MNKTSRYSQTQIADFVATVRRDGYCVLPRHFSESKIRIWRDAFTKLMDERVKNGTASARGPARYYISLPFVAPFADPEIYEDPDILAILEELAGPDFVMPELATDTPLNGSDFQVIHRDITQKSPNLADLDPAEPFQFGVNFPLVRVTRDNGPFEVVPGTHLLTDAESKEWVKFGRAEREIVPLLMEIGDVMVRDVRGLHRGTPNRTDEPRPMVVVGYNRAAHLRPQLKIQIPRSEFERLSPRAKQMLRLNPIVESPDAIKADEAYSNLYFLDDDK
jgi:hypothetical protein